MDARMSIVLHSKNKFKKFGNCMFPLLSIPIFPKNSAQGEVPDIKIEKNNNCNYKSVT